MSCDPRTVYPSIGLNIRIVNDIEQDGSYPSVGHQRCIWGLGTQEHYVGIALWPFIQQVVDQRISNGLREGEDQTPTSFLLDDTDAVMFPVYVPEPKCADVLRP